MKEYPGVSRLPVPNLPSGRVQRKVPAPFTRPSISIGTAIQERRQWRTVPAHAITQGDTIPGLGTVCEVVEEVKQYRADQLGRGIGMKPRVLWTVTVAAGDGNERVYAGEEQVWCFTKPDCG